MRSPEFRENNNEDSFDRAINSLEDYLVKNGKPKDYDPETGFFRQAADDVNYDAYVKIITVADRDASVTELDEPIMYDAAVFTKNGREKAGMFAYLSEEQFDQDQHRQIRYEFQTDKNVRRMVIQDSELQTDEFLHPDEVGFMADQLETIGSVGEH